MLLLSICVCLALSLPRRSHQSCFEGKPRECLDAEFAPGSDLAGEGFDVTKLERKGAFVISMAQWKRKGATCTLCSNPYLGNKNQKLPSSVVDWRTKHSCSASVTSALHRSSESLVSSSVSSVENDWQLNLDVSGKGSGSLMLAGTDSKLANYAMEKTKSDKFSFTSQSVSCEYYSYRVSSSPILHKEFRKALKQLPKVYSPESKRQYYKLIDVFGTHYIAKVKLGGSIRSVTSIRQCQASLQGLSVEEVGMCLRLEASASVKATDMKTEAKHCQEDSSKMETTSSFSGLFNDRFTEIKGGHTSEPDLLFSADKNPSAYKDWVSTLPGNPDIFSYSLAALHELLPASGVRKNLRSAVSHYILEKGLQRNCSERCQAGIRSDSRDSCDCRCHNELAVNQDCCPTRKGMARVIVTVQRASGLWGDTTTQTDGYVKVAFNGVIVTRSPVINNNDNPHWEMVVDLGAQDLTSGHKVGFEVWDEDNKWDDDLLGKCEQVLSAGVQEEVCVLNHGKLFYKWEVRCAPSLSGGLCEKYRPTPMSQSLRGLYVSRHARPIPEAVLLRMGVFVNGTGWRGKQSDGLM